MASTSIAHEGTNVLKRTWQEFSQDDCSVMAASLAYYTIFSLPPLLVIVITVAGFFGGADAVEGRINDEIGRVVGEGGKEQINAMIQAANQPGRGLWATIIGVAVMVFGATGVVAQLQTALNKAWQVEPDPEQGGIKNFVVKRLLSFGMILGIAFLLLVSLVLTSVLTAAGETISRLLPGEVSQGLLMAIQIGVSLLITAALFAAMFKWLPDAEVAWRDVWIGAAVTAVWFEGGKFLIGLYLGGKDPGAYGAAGSLVLILIWIYYSGWILFLGAEFTQVWARRHGDRIEPSEGAVRVVKEKKRVRDTNAPRDPTSPQTAAANNVRD